MSIKLVLKYLGVPLAMVGAFLGLPLFWSVFVARDGAHASFLLPMTVALLGGFALVRFIPRQQRSLTRREGLALVMSTVTEDDA